MKTRPFCIKIYNMCALNIESGDPTIMGVSCSVGGGMNIAVCAGMDKPLTMCIYNLSDSHRILRVKIPEKCRFGDVWAFRLSGLDFSKYTYSFYDDSVVFCDPYSKALSGCDKWGKRKPRSVFAPCVDYDWEEDEHPSIPLEDVIMYTIHVRGFTRHTSSMVKYPGCFEGITEKIPYLKELGINQIELMPAYDFNEIIANPPYPANGTHIPQDSKEARELASALKAERVKRKKISINYWGYSKEAFYFAPKAAYSGIKDPVRSFKDMVKALHKNGIEVVMQFYFPAFIRPQLMTDCIRHWVLEYHIDGAVIMGEKLPRDHFLTDPILADTKIYLRGLDELPAGHRRNTALIQDNFMYDMRKYLKSDEDMLRSFTFAQLNNPKEHGIINYITNYYGFTLNDLVSYDRKHNEDNGEENRDGTDYNFSWNCGVEGVCRKKFISRLRQRQIFNALSFVFLAAGIPKIMAGDEFCNSQNGNNNAYCQDNPVTWLNWDQLSKKKEYHDFVKSMIAFRKANAVFRQSGPKSMNDTNHVGYPEVSYHGEQAWMPHFESYSRSIGLLYTGRNEFYYIAYNLYWIEERFALPKLPKGKKWKLIMDSSKGFVEEEAPLEDQTGIRVISRCVVLLKAVDTADSTDSDKTGSDNTDSDRKDSDKNGSDNADSRNTDSDKKQSDIADNDNTAPVNMDPENTDPGDTDPEDKGSGNTDIRDTESTDQNTEIKNTQKAG